MIFKLKINANNLLLYMILIPFLHPRGFDEYIPLYKNLFTIWLYVALAGIFLLVIFEVSQNRMSTKAYLWGVMLYFGVMSLLTLFIRQSFSNALQKCFATPALCVLGAIYLNIKPEPFIRIVNNLLKLNFFLNLTIFNPLLWKEYFAPITNHITFIGHVQLGAQLGILGVFLGYLEYYFYSKNKKKLIWQIFLSISVLVISFTSASYIALIILFIFAFLEKTKFRKVFTYRSLTYVWFYLLGNILLLSLIVLYSGASLEILGFSLNGRGYIWKEAFESFMKSPIYGYGVQGVSIKVFWSYWVGDGQGMNYMHNQLLQVLNDGGVILFIPFIYMLILNLKNLDKLKNGRLKFWSMICIMSMLITMTFESTMEYFYVFFMFITIAYLPDIVLREEKGNRVTGEKI